ncbi:MAG: neutral zinc metallopeptidase [Deltaproteobacteria bacterium]|nr:neutral zinc metallopeptidase [Deltaproteobacteria bacterium]
MRFGNEGNDSDIQDRRGGGGGGIAKAGLGLGGMVVVGVIALLLGKNPIEVIGAVQGNQAPRAGTNRAGRAPSPGPRDADERRAEQLVRRATTDIQNYWQTALPQQTGGQSQYQRTQLVLFADETRSPCGAATAQSGPFYCPGDQLVYIDLSFYAELARRFRAPGDFAQAYVLAHEFGHHLQKLLGVEPRVRALQRQNRAESNALSVKLELQADCFAGVWAASAARRSMLDAGDIEEGLAAAASIGDDRIAQMGGRRVSPERFTHGSSAERVRWFRAGMASESIRACDTFGRGTLSP